MSRSQRIRRRNKEHVLAIVLVTVKVEIANQQSLRVVSVDITVVIGIDGIGDFAVRKAVGAGLFRLVALDAVPERGPLVLPGILCPESGGANTWSQFDRDMRIVGVRTGLGRRHARDVIEAAVTVDTSGIEFVLRDHVVIAVGPRFVDFEDAVVTVSPESIASSEVVAVEPLVSSTTSGPPSKRSVTTTLVRSTLPVLSTVIV